MKNLKFAIIGASETENTKDLVAEIENRSFKSYLVNFENMLFEISRNKFKIEHNGIDINIFDIFIFRGYTKYFVEARILAEKLINENKIVVDEIVAKRYVPSKIFESSKFARYRISHPKTFQYFHFKLLCSNIDKISFPAIVKSLYGMKGRGIKKIENKKEMLSFFKKNNVRDYLIQECMEIDGDIRVFVVDGKALGAMKRFIIPGDFRSNISLGAGAEKIRMTKGIEKLALRSVKAMELEIAGVDIIEYRKKLYVLEVNSAPQWQKFKEITEINPAKNIIDLALKKYIKKNS